MASTIKECQIHVVIEEDGKPIFAGAIGQDKNWTRLECAFIIQAMSTVMEGTTDELIVEMGIARLVGVVKRAGAAAKEVGLTRKTYTRMMDREASYKTRRTKND